MGTDRPDLPSADADLVKRAQAGDPAAFHELVDRYADFLFALAVSLSGNTADAEDMVQETFSGAYRGLKGFRGQASVKTWLAHILMRQRARHLRMTHRGKARFIPLEEAPESDVGAPGPHAAADARIDVMAAIRRLSPEHQEVVLLREIQGLSYGEMAEILEIPRGTVESRLFRARRELQQRLGTYLW